MADRDFRFERHYELWKEQNRQLVRWAFGTVVFAVLVLLRVLTPYTQLSDRVADGQTQLAGVERELEATDVKLRALGKLGERLEAVRRSIDAQPWSEEKERLIRALRDITEAHGRLVSAPPAQILAALQDSGAGSADIAQQAPMPRPTNPLAQAATVLGLDAPRIAAAASAGTWSRFLEEGTRAKVQAEADAKVRRIFLRVDDGVLKPLEQLREDRDVAGALPEIGTVVGRTRSEMEQWVNQRLGNRGWYETIQQKDRELSELTSFLQSRQASLARAVQEQQRTLEPRRAALAEQRAGQQRRAEQIRTTLGELNVKMQKLLPEWLRDLVSPEDMLRLYPAVLLALLAVVGFKAGLIRHHYLVVRAAHRPERLSWQDTAVSSLWTLVYRGVGGTASTAGVYLVGLLLLWWLFEQGTVLTQAWSVGHAAAPWTPTGGWLVAVRWVGRVAFVAMLAAVPVTLARDYQLLSRLPAGVSPSPPG